MKSDALQGQSSSRSVWSATEYVSEDLTLFSRNPALFIDLNPARNSTRLFGIRPLLHRLRTQEVGILIRHKSILYRG